MVIAIHPGTVHRWEAAGSGTVPVDGVAASILMALDQRMDHGREHATGFDPARVGQRVVQALIVGGALVALGILINELTNTGQSSDVSARSGSNLSIQRNETEQRQIKVAKGSPRPSRRGESPAA
jgi:hypothetical protein